MGDRKSDEQRNFSLFLDPPWYANLRGVGDKTHKRGSRGAA